MTEHLAHTPQVHACASGRGIPRALALLSITALVGFTVGCSTAESSPADDTDASASSVETGDAAPGDENTGNSDADAETAGGEDASEFCASADELASHLELATMTEFADPSQAPARFAEAAEAFDTISPPANIEFPWQNLSELFSFGDTMLEGKTIETAEQLTEALSSTGDEAFAMVLMAPGSIEAVGVQLQRDCGSDLGFPEPALDDACGAIDSTTLEAVLLGTAPSGSPMRWAGGTTECSWESGDTELVLVVGPAAMLRDDVLTGLSPLETADGTPPAEIYDGALGPFRSGSGRTAISNVGETGVLVAVRSGDSDFEKDHAAAIAQQVASGL